MTSQRITGSLLVALSLLGCNMLTNADQFLVEGDSAGDDGAGNESSDNGDGGTGLISGGGSSQGGTGGTSQGGTSSQGGATEGGAGGSGAGSEGGAPPVGDFGDAVGVSISKISVYQAVESVVYQGGPQTPTVSLVAGRPAVVRVFATGQNLSGAPLSAYLTIGNQAPIVIPVPSLSGGSDGNYGSTINFEVPGNKMVQGGQVKVEFKEPIATAADSNPGARSGDMNWNLEASHKLRVTIIPVQYNADGSGRMPDTSQAQLNAYRDAYMAVYPATEVQVTLGATFSWNSGISPNGGGWDSLLNSLAELRDGANVAEDEFYYGAFAPASSFEQFCGGGCVAGLGFIGDPNALYTRAAIGLGYTGDISFGTAVHETGHNHGRPHSPCGGVSGADPAYPHAGGEIGVWGMNIFTHEMIPSNHTDFMGYCDPVWVSDYVYEKLLNFMQQNGGQNLYIPENMKNLEWERVSLGVDASTFLSPLTMETPPMGELETVTITDDQGESRTAEGVFYAYDHLPGGVLFLKKESHSIVQAEVSLSIGGASRVFTAVR